MKVATAMSERRCRTGQCRTQIIQLTYCTAYIILLTCNWHQPNARDQILCGKDGSERTRLLKRKAVFDPNLRQAEGTAFASKIRTRSGWRSYWWTTAMTDPSRLTSSSSSLSAKRGSEP